MESIKEVINGKYGKSLTKLEQDYQKDYDNDMVFRKLANSTKLSNEVLIKYTTKLENAACEHKNCKECKNLMECKNEVNGYCLTPEANGNSIEFSYYPCKYKIKLDEQNKYLDNVYYFDIPKDIKNANMRDINTIDKKRYPVIKWIKEFIENIDKDIPHKGLYLNGNFGCGKTYLLSAMLNELAKKGKKVAIIYYPEFLRSLKASFGDNDEYQSKFNYIKKVDLLLLDDIGADSVTEWSRDEVLGTILQYRMEEKLQLLSKTFENKKVRTVWDSNEEKYYISVVDIIEVLTESEEPRKYWNWLKTKLSNEENFEAYPKEKKSSS